MLENKFQSDLIKDIYKLIPGCVVLKNDSQYLQGFPDLTVLYGNKYILLECKQDADSQYQPNQEYYLTKFNGYTIHLENREEILDEIQRSFGISGSSRVSKR